MPSHAFAILTPTPFIVRVAFVLPVVMGPAGLAFAQGGSVADDFRRTLECPRRQYCTRVSTCEEAVHLWCVCGYTGADRDKDGVPCEDLCGQSTATNLARVASIKGALGCR